jgi:hypothetical protein
MTNTRRHHYHHARPHHHQVTDMENQWASSYETREMIKRLIREEDADPVRYEVGFCHDDSDGGDGDGDGADDFVNGEKETSAGAENGDDDIMVHRSDEPSDADAGASGGVSTKNSSAAASADSFDADANFFTASPATTAGASAMMQSLNPLSNSSISTSGKRSSKVRIAP